MAFMAYLPRCYQAAPEDMTKRAGVLSKKVVVGSALLHKVDTVSHF